MTAIVGVERDGKVWIGGDSAGVSGSTLTVRADEKVFVNGPMIMGGTTSFRMIQLLRYAFKIPKKKQTQTDFEYLVTDFVAAMRKMFVDHGYTHASGNAKCGDFLLGYKGTLYTIFSDFQVSRSVSGYAAVGCGQDMILGALHALMSSSGEMSPPNMLKHALDAATAHNTNVTPPYVILHQ